MTVSLQTLTRFPLFANLSQPTLTDLAGLMVLQSYPAGTLVQIQEEPCRFVGFVYAGAGVIFRMAANGREQVLSKIGPGMHFNTVPALDVDQRLRGSIRAVSPLKIMQIPTAEYRSLLQSHSDLAYLILTDFAHRLDALTNLVEELSLHSVRSRLAKFLLEHATGEEITQQWTQDEIAAYLGTVRDVVGRTLRAFMDAGWIQRQGDSLIILERHKLEEEANFG